MIYWAIGLLVAGMIFAIAEIIVPGFGFFGIGAAIFFVVSWIITIFFIPYGIFIVLVEAVLTVAAIAVILSYLKSRNPNGTIILNETLKEDKKEDNSIFLNREGIAKTSLKPFGKVDFSGNIIDVCADVFIEKNKRVKAVKYSDGKLYVEAL